MAVVSREEADIRLIKACICQRLFNNHSIPLVNLDAQYNDILNILEDSFTNGSNYSALLVGPRGTGKSSTFRHALNNVKAGKAILVELNGHIHSDDRLVLTKIIDKLDLNVNTSSQSVAACFIQVFELIVKDKRPVIFFLEHFEMFTVHIKQMLLYNLFDLCHGYSNHKVVIGMTTRMDILELLEKRVKSRFSHRIIQFYYPITFEAYMDIIKSAFDLGDLTPVSSKTRSQFTQTVIKPLLENQDLNKIIKHLFSFSKNVSVFLRALCPAISQLDHTNVDIEKTAKIIVSTVKEQLMDYKVQTIKSLSQLELCLLIAMMKYQDDTDVQEANFEIIYDYYKRFAAIHNLAQKKIISLMAFENLVKYELLKPVASYTKCPAEFRMYVMQVLPIQIREAVSEYPDGLNIVIRRWIQ